MGVLMGVLMHSKVSGCAVCGAVLCVEVWKW